jgi:type III secretion protein D
MTSPSVLRVLNGRLAGTEKQLPASGTVSIGHQFWQDVVIRDPATKGIAVDLQVDGEVGARITVLTGEALLLGSHVSEGQTAILPAYVPFSIGGVALAWGDPESARWTEASEIAGSTPTPSLPPPSPQDEAMALLGKAGEQVSGWFTRKRRPWRSRRWMRSVFAAIRLRAPIMSSTASGSRRSPLPTMPRRAA